MPETDMVRVTLKTKQYDADFPSGKIDVFLANLHKFINAVPAEHREKAELSIGESWCGDSSTPIISITYERNATDEERRNRLESEKARVMDEARHIRNRTKYLRLEASAVGIDPADLDLMPFATDGE